MFGGYPICADPYKENKHIKQILKSREKLSDSEVSSESPWASYLHFETSGFSSVRQGYVSTNSLHRVAVRIK